MWDTAFDTGEISEMAPRRHLFPSLDSAGLERLKERIRAIEGNAARFEDHESERDGNSGGMFGFGAPEIDNLLPRGGLEVGALHEAIAADAGAATGFCAALIGRIPSSRPVLWCEGRHALDYGRLYGPGLARFGLDPGRLILVRAKRDEDVLWAMEEGLRSGGPAAVVGEVRAVSMTAGRLLQLAATSSGAAAFLIRPRGGDAASSAAATRWRVAADGTKGAEGGNQGEPGIGFPCWRAEMFRCRGGAARTWTMEWHDETGRFAVAAPVRDRPDRTQPARLAG
jgi:protein ImuA